MKLSDIVNRPKIEKKRANSTKYRQEELIASLFFINFNNSFRLVEKIVDDLFKSMETDFGIIRNSTYIVKYNRIIKKFFVEFIVNELNWLMNRDQRLNKIIQNIEKYYKDVSFKKNDPMEDFLSDILKMNIDKYLLAIKIVSLASISNKKLKLEQMKSVGIRIEPYKPKGSKVSWERDLIYRQIPIQLRELQSQYGKNRKGKSDNKAAVYKAIDFLERKNVIKKYKYDPKNIYDNWKKRKPDNL